VHNPYASFESERTELLYHAVEHEHRADRLTAELEAASASAQVYSEP
jgi:hypothetical protein